MTHPYIDMLWQLRCQLYVDVGIKESMQGAPCQTDIAIGINKRKIDALLNSIPMDTIETITTPGGYTFAMFNNSVRDNVLSMFKTVKTVAEWNTARDMAIPAIGIEAMGIIDQSGLIVKVLGADHVFYHIKTDGRLGSGEPVTAEFSIGYDPYK